MVLPVRLRRTRQPEPTEIVRADVSNMLNRLFGGWSFDHNSNENPLAALSSFGVDIREDNDHIYVEADLPGFSKNDVEITISDGILVIAAERREEEPAEHPSGSSDQQQNGQSQPGDGAQGAAAAQRDGQRGQSPQRRNGHGEYLLRERRFQRIVRSFTLPANVDEEHVEAHLADGVLKITLNKREESKPRRIRLT